MKHNSKCKTYHLSDQTCKQIAILADESGESATAIVETAINFFYQRDQISQNLLLEKLSELDSLLKKIDYREEVFYTWSRFVVSYIFAALPDMFETDGSFRLINDKGRMNLNQLEAIYKKVNENKRKSFLQEVFADMRNPA